MDEAGEAIRAERDEALADIKILRGRALRFTEELEAWYMDPNDVRAITSQVAAVEFTASFQAVMGRVIDLYERGVIVRRPGMDIKEPDNG
jgi:hypothetical protein